MSLNFQVIIYIINQKIPPTTSTSRGMITTVRHGIPHSFRTQTTNDYTEFQLVIIDADEDKDHAFSNLYTSLGHHTNILDLVELHPSHIAIGNFNAHHTASVGTALIDQLMDIHSAIINEPSVSTTEYGSTIDIAISSLDLIRNYHWSQVDNLLFDHIASHILIQYTQKLIMATKARNGQKNY